MKNLKEKTTEMSWNKKEEHVRNKFLDAKRLFYLLLVRRRLVRSIVACQS